MKQVIALALLLPGAAWAAPAARPYTPPELGPEPTPQPARDVASVEVVEEELGILVRPTGRSPRLGAAVAGGRLPIRGYTETAKPDACAVRRWYALEPAGWVCGAGVKPSKQPPKAAAALVVAEGERLPFRYYNVVVKEGEEIPLYASPGERGGEPWRKLGRGDSVAVAGVTTIDGEKYLELVDGMVVPARGTAAMGPGSSWQGVALDDKLAPPFGWVTPEQAKVLEAPDPRARVVEKLARRTRLPLLEDHELELQPAKGKRKAKTRRYVRVGEDRWMDSADLNEVRVLPRPPGTDGNDRWIDVDLGEQVLVAYDKDRPVFATLVSSGRAMPTPRGTYRIWAKAATTTMKSQPYEDKGYYVHRVPWVLFFQAHNALHAAYWHDRFGTKKSHGCVNLSPLDARRMFEWATPPLPDGWSGVRPVDLLASIAVHVRDSHKPRPWFQERPIGPPDREEERRRTEQADERRAAEAAAQAAQAGQAAP